jgi:uncharacterized Zn finger protein
MQEGADMAGRLDIGALKKAAGDKVFGRGEAYARNGRVEIFGADDRRVVGRAFGTDTYRVELAWRGKGFAGSCTCPAHESTGLCKHMVALALVADAADEAELAEARERMARFRARILALSPEDLVDLALTATILDPERFDPDWTGEGDDLDEGW